MKRRLILFDRAVAIPAKTEAFRTQLVSSPGIGKRRFELRIRLCPQRLVCALQPVTGLGICIFVAVHLRQCTSRTLVLLQLKEGSSEKQVGPRGRRLGLLK